jgi:tetratricopeptide (TPR) repeat protein
MFSDGFQRLYCDATLYDPFSELHPVRFARVLPFQPEDPVVDDGRLLGAEVAHLADRNELTRREVIDAYARCGLLSEADADNVKSAIDFYNGADFFDLMGLVYANAGMYICALRWYRELIRELEAPRPESYPGLDDEEVHASVGYCLYALGLFAEAIAWTKSCSGSDLDSDRVCRELMEHEAQLAGGKVLNIERAAGITRYTVSALEPVQTGQATEQIKAALRTFAPHQKFIIDWVSPDTPEPGIQPEGYPFRAVWDASDLPRHKMNLLFAICAQADALVESGHAGEARQWLFEAARLEPEAGFIRDRLLALRRSSPADPR